MEDIKVKIRREVVPFTQVPNELLWDDRITPRAVKLYCYLSSKTNLQDWSFWHSDLKNNLGCSTERLRLALKELKSTGWIHVEQVKEDGKFKGNVYTLNLSVALKTSDGKLGPESSHGKRYNGKAVTPETTRHNKTILSNNTTSVNKTLKEDDSKNIESSLFPDIDPNVRRLFKNSVVNDFKIVEKTFDAPEFSYVDLNYYFNAVKDWSDMRGMKRTADGWLATIRSWIRKDLQAGKLVRIKSVDDIEQMDKELLDWYKL